MLWALRSHLNASKWPKMAPNGPHQYSVVILSTTVHDIGPFLPFWAKKMDKQTLNWPKMAKNWPNPIAAIEAIKFQGIGIFDFFPHTYT